MSESLGIQWEPSIGELLARAEAAEKRTAEMRDALWECMKHAGADTSYADSAEHADALGGLPEQAVEAVRELRKDYDDDEAVKHLEAALTDAGKYLASIDAPSGVVQVIEHALKGKDA